MRERLVTHFVFAVALLFVIPSAALGQNSSASRDGHAATRDRIAALARTLHADIGIRPEDAVRQLSTATRVAAQVEREVDNYVSTLEAVSVDANAILAGLKDVLTPLGEFTATSLFASIWKPESVRPEVRCNFSPLSPQLAPLPFERSLIVASGFTKGSIKALSRCGRIARRTVTSRWSMPLAAISKTMHSSQQESCIRSHQVRAIRPGTRGSSCGGRSSRQTGRTFA